MLGGLLLAILSVGTWFFFRLLDIALLPIATYSGLLLYAVLFFLTGYSLRKKIRFLPLGSSELWLQIHIFSGLFSGVLFGIHLCWHLPRGGFEIALASIYLLTFLSGVVGWVLSRELAKRLTTRGGEVLFEKIPRELYLIREDVKELVQQCANQTNSSAISDFYRNRLRSFFTRPRHVLSHLIQSTRPRSSLLRELNDFQRYVNDFERETLEGIAVAIRRKDSLDYQYALQLALKSWLFVHVPVSCALLIFSTVHMLLVFAFSRGIG